MEISDRFWTEDAVSDTDPDMATLAMAARSMIVARRALQASLPVDFLHDPALDILLALFIAAVDHRSAGADGLAAATTITPGIARRWTTALAQEGLVIAHGDSVALTTDGHDRVAAAIRAVIASQVRLYQGG